VSRLARHTYGYPPFNLLCIAWGSALLRQPKRRAERPARRDLPRPAGQDNFVSHTMKAEEDKRMKLIADYKSKAEVILLRPPPPSKKRRRRGGDLGKEG
jgi:hypothetical protein